MSNDDSVKETEISENNDIYTCDNKSEMKHGDAHGSISDIEHHGTNGYKNEDGRETESRKAMSILATWSVEPVLFLFLFARQIYQSCIMNLMLDKACSTHLNYSKEICGNLSHYEVQKVEVERLANIYNQYSILATMGIGALMMMFAGSWSDRYGSKLLLLIGILGMLFDDIGVLLNTIYMNASLQFLILSSAASGISGGYICVMTILSRLASDLSSVKLRTIKYSLFQFVFGVGFNLGTLIGGILYKYYSYQTIYTVAAVGHLIALVWTLAFIPETKKLNEDINVKWTQKLKDFFSMKNMVEGFKVLIKVRPNHGRQQLWLLVLSMSIITITYAAFYNIAYVYAFHMYNWNPTMFSTVVSSFGWAGYISTTLFVAILARYFKVGDAMIGFFGTVSLASKNLCIAFAIHPWIYYLGHTFAIINTATVSAASSKISKIVEKDELGKVFAFKTACEALVPMLAVIIMTHIYNATVTFFPGLCYLIDVILLIVPAASFWWMSRL